MILLLIDTETDNPMAATVKDIDQDFQADEWVKESVTDPRTCTPGRWVIVWELHDGEGLRARWKRNEGDTGLPKLVHAEPRWTGDWKEGT